MRMKAKVVIFFRKVVKMRKVMRRWGHHQDVMTAFRLTIGREAVRVWEQGKDKNAKKVDHLRRKWRNGTSRAVDQEWRGIKIGEMRKRWSLREGE